MLNNKKLIKELQEKNEKLKNDYGLCKQWYESAKYRVNELENEIKPLMEIKEQLKVTMNMNEILLQALCEKYHKGVAILYDEHNPRKLIIVKNGKQKETERMTSICFRWDSCESPVLEITEG